MYRSPGRSGQATNFSKSLTKGPQNLADDTRVTRARWASALVLSLLLLSIGAAPAAADATFHAASEPSFAAQWGLENGARYGFAPTAVEDSDIDAPDAWAITKGAGMT